MPNFVSNQTESVRMFRNPIMEKFSHIHPITPAIVYTPVILASGWFGFHQVGPMALPAMLLGLFIWTMLEYFLHRWVFHFEPKSRIGQDFHFVFHGVHHDYPRDNTRLVMPLLFSVPLAIVHYWAYSHIFGLYCNAVYAGLVIGYLFYDMTHFITHCPPMKNPVMRFLRSYHLRHHYENGHTAFGVTSPLWDYVLGTLPAYMRKDKQSRNAVS